MPTKDGLRIRLYAIIDWSDAHTGELRVYEEKTTTPCLEAHRGSKYIEPRAVGLPIVFPTEKAATDYVDGLPHGIAKYLKVLPLDEG